MHHVLDGVSALMHTLYFGSPDQPTLLFYGQTPLDGSDGRECSRLDLNLVCCSRLEDLVVPMSWLHKDLIVTVFMTRLNIVLGYKQTCICCWAGS